MCHNEMAYLYEWLIGQSWMLKGIMFVGNHFGAMISNEELENYRWNCWIMGHTYSCEGAEVLRSDASWSRRNLFSRSFFRRSPGSSPVNSFGFLVRSMEALVRSFSVKSGRIVDALALINLRISLWINSYSSFGGIIPPVLNTWFPPSNSRCTLRTSFIIPPVPISGSSRK